MQPVGWLWLLAFGTASAAVGFCISLFFRSSDRRQKIRRNKKFRRRLERTEELRAQYPPGSIVKYDPSEEGHPCQPRGRVWNNAERTAHRHKNERKVLRIVGTNCPPHEPEYDESVNETYCSKCLARLPNQ